jgi:hypothetical protein
MEHRADGKDAPAAATNPAKTALWPVLVGALALVLLAPSLAVSGDSASTDRSFSCQGDKVGAIAVRVLPSGDVRLEVGAQVQAVSPAAFRAAVNTLEDAIADWHGGGYIPVRERSLITGQPSTLPRCDSGRAVPNCEPVSDASDSVWSRYGGGFLQARISLVGNCVDGRCYRADVNWLRIETIEAAADCLVQAIPGWRPRPRPSGDGRVRESSPIKPQK